MATKNFYIFGQGISFSMSPYIHAAAFAHYGLPHTYEIHQTETVEELPLLIQSSTFGGASVTMPHKLNVKKYCSSITDDAAIIGAVNTLIVEDAGTGRKIKGANSDWVGLRNILREQAPPSTTAGLVIGAGGASRAALYAMHKAGIPTIYLHNRTRATAEKVAESYAPFFKIIVISELQEFSTTTATPPQVIIGTIPADRTSEHDFPGALFTQPEGLCIDMAYKPWVTPLMTAAARENSRRGSWKVVNGIEVLLAQAHDQFTAWTGLEAPGEVMRKGVEDRMNALRE